MDDLDVGCWTTVRESVLPCPDHDPLLFAFLLPIPIPILPFPLPLPLAFFLHSPAHFLYFPFSCRIAFNDHVHFSYV